MLGVAGYSHEYYIYCVGYVICVISVDIKLLYARNKIKYMEALLNAQ